MRKSRRLVVALAVSSLVAAGGVAVGLVANAKTQATCDGSATPEAITDCQIAQQAVFMPTAITLVVTLKSGNGQNNQDIAVTLNGGCISNYEGANYQEFSPPGTAPMRTPVSTAAPVTINVPLPYPDPYQCNMGLTAQLVAVLPGPSYEGFTTGSFQLALDYTPYVSPTASSSSASVPLVKGYDDKCLDDKGNSSANRTKVIIWTCDSADSAQSWKFTSSGELQHDGKCANDQGNGGSGTKVTLWTCNGSSDEKWSHPSSDDEFVLSSTAHGQLCLTDPGYSKINRTQLIVYPCHNTSDQHWTA